MSAPQRPDWTLVRCESHAAMRREAIRRWQRVSATRRVEAAWDMVKEAWTLKKRPADELRFQRTVTVLRNNVNYLGKEDLIAAKRHANRPQDQADIESLRGGG